jgi:hypothetical protein
VPLFFGFCFAPATIFLNALSAVSAESEAPASRAASRKRFYCAGSSGFGEAFSRVIEITSVRAASRNGLAGAWLFSAKTIP